MFSFGTYKLQGTSLEVSLKNIEKTSITSIDTAQLYRNEEEIGNFFKHYQKPFLITTKLWEQKVRSMDLIINSIKTSVEKLKSNDRIRIRVLLHHPSYSHVWKALEECVKCGLIDEIGVSNHNIEDLEKLCEYAEIMPCINQLEIHPFIDPYELQPLLQYCQSKGLNVQAHTALVKGLYWSDPELIRAANELQLTKPQYLVSWAASQLGVTNVCITTTNKTHLQELVSIPLFKKPLRNLVVKRHRLYPFQTIDEPQKIDWNSLDSLAKTILTDIENIRENNHEDITDLCLMLPSVKSKYSSLTRNVAQKAYPELTDEQRFSKLNDLSKPLRIYCDDRLKKKENEKRKEMLNGTCCVRKTKIKKKNDEISDAVLNPTPMPVDVSKRESLEPFFSYLSSNEPLVGNREFFKGAIIEERMDMCKQVTGPDHIEGLCESVSKNDHIRHFLLGNNIAFRNDQEKAHAIGDIILSNQDIETWYLAGNYIGPQAIEIMCNALKTNTKCKSLWLKRNPIGAEGAKYLRDMMYHNQTLKLLDLDNCGLLDEGMVNLFSPVTKNDNYPFCISNIQHLYLDANGITPHSVPVFCDWLKRHKHNLKSLYLSINRIEDEGVKMICDVLQGSMSLKRFSVGSNRLTDDISSVIVDFALGCEKLICLNLGCYKSTFDMGEKPNFFTNVKPFIKLVEQHPSLLYLDLAMNNIPDDDIRMLVHFTKETGKPITIVGSQIGTNPQVKSELHLQQDKDLKFVKHPKKVLHIDSIYRNRM